MAKQNINAKQGFTIIEVVLVLAIAGLIFLMVFIALPALQRSQRDTQRREDMGRFLSQLTQYQSNNANKIPSEVNSTNPTKAWNDFITNYLRVGGDAFTDPNGVEYKVDKVTVCKSDNDCEQKTNETDYLDAKIQVYTNARCNGEEPTYVQGSRKVAFTYKMEGAGIYCGSNN